MYLVTYIGDIAEESKPLFLNEGLLEIGFSILEQVNCSDSVDDPEDLEQVFLMSATKVAQYLYIEESYPRLKKLFKYLIHKFIE